MTHSIFVQIAEELKVASKQIEATVSLLDEGATVPFIASEYYEGTHWLASFAVYALTVSALE